MIIYIYKIYILPGWSDTKVAKVPACLPQPWGPVVGHWGNGTSSGMSGNTLSLLIGSKAQGKIFVLCRTVGREGQVT